MAQAVHAATILTGDPNTNNIIPTNHGSAATGTPNINLNWSAAGTDTPKWDGYANWNGRGEVYQLDKSNDGTFTIAFTPDTGWNVSLTALDIDVWSGTGSRAIDWTVTGSSSGVLGSGTGFNGVEGQKTTLNLGLTGANNEVVTLTLSNPGAPNGSYLAMDNLAFDQVAAGTVPEPSSAALLGLGLGAAAMRRRK